MSPDQVVAASVKYGRELEKRGYAAAPNPDVPFPSTRTAIQHAQWMCSQIRAHVDEGQVEKAMRWLGFVQAILWSNGIFSITEMKADNRTDKAT